MTTDHVLVAISPGLDHLFDAGLIYKTVITQGGGSPIPSTQGFNWVVTAAIAVEPACSNMSNDAVLALWVLYAAGLVITLEAASRIRHTQAPWEQCSAIIAFGLGIAVLFATLIMSL